MAAPFSSAVTHDGTSSRAPAPAPLKHWISDATVKNSDPSKDDFKVAFFSEHDPLDVSSIQCEGTDEREPPRASSHRLLADAVPRLRGRAADASLNDADLSSSDD